MYTAFRGHRGYDHVTFFTVFCCAFKGIAQIQQLKIYTFPCVKQVTSQVCCVDVFVTCTTPLQEREVTTVVNLASAASIQRSDICVQPLRNWKVAVNAGEVDHLCSVLVAYLSRAFTTPPATAVFAAAKSPNGRLAAMSKRSPHMRRPPPLLISWLTLV